MVRTWLWTAALLAALVVAMFYATRTPPAPSDFGVPKPPASGVRNGGDFR